MFVTFVAQMFSLEVELVSLYPETQRPSFGHVTREVFLALLSLVKLV